MAAKRRARRPRSDDSKEVGRNSANEGSDVDDDEEESGNENAIPAEPNEMRAGEPSSPSREDTGVQRSVEASPTRGGVASKTKTTNSKQVMKPRPASQEEDEAEDSGDASPARSGPLPVPDNSADAGHDNKRGATPKRGEKRSPPPLQEHERPEKRAAGTDAETVAVKSPKRMKKSKRSAEKDRRKKKKRKQLKKTLTKPTSSLQFLESGLNDNKEDTPSSPETAQENQHHGREIAGQEQSNTSSPQDERRACEEEQLARGDELHDREMAEQEPSNTSPLHDERTAHEEEQQEKIAEQEHAGGTSPHDKDMHSAHGEEQLEEEVANQEPADDTSTSPPKDNHSVLKDTAPPHEKNKDQEDEETGAQVNGKALPFRNAPSTKPHGSETERKPAVVRSWSYDDKLKILNALVEHAQSHDGALPDSSHLLANLTFDKIDANEEKLADKIRKLKTRYHRMLSQGCPSNHLAHRLFKLSEKLWGQVDEDDQVEPTSRDFSALSKLYPHLAEEVKAYAELHSSRDLIMSMFMTIGDEKARDLDANCKKLQIEAFKLELGQASLINELLSTASSLTHVRF